MQLKILQQITGQTVPQNTSHNKCDKERTMRRRLYAKPNFLQAFKSYSLSHIIGFPTVCDQMDHVYSGVHQLRDKSSTPHEAEQFSISINQYLFKFNCYILSQRQVVGQGHQHVAVNAIGCVVEIKYLICSFSRSGSGPKRSVDLRHSIRFRFESKKQIINDFLADYTVQYYKKIAILNFTIGCL